MTKIAEGDRITVKVGDERGMWGIVRKILHGEYHVAIAGADSADRVYDREEISRPKDQTDWNAPASPYGESSTEEW
jgi:ribosomal protein L24